MAIKNWDESFLLVLKEEGGFTNNPHDPGGATNLGVTKAAWENYVGHKVEVQDIKNLEPFTVKPFYKKMYWDRCRGDDLPSGVDYAVMDMAVNSGPARGMEALQTAVGVNADGVIGDETMKAVAAANPTHVIEAICDTRLAYLKKLTTWAYFGKGWGARVEAVRAAALKMATQ